MRQLFFLSLILLSIHPVFSQHAKDSLFVGSVLQDIKNQYSNLLSRDAPVYNGRLYHPFGTLNDNGHTFFLSDKYVSGTIIYDGFSFSGLNIRYDILRDQLVLLNPDQTAAILVIKAHVDSFYLHNHRYIHLKPNSKDVRNFPAPGYYDVLYDGKVTLLAKRIKAVSEKITPTRVEKTVSQEDNYFLLKNSEYSALRNKKILLKLLQSTQIENQQFMRENKLDFKKDKENAMVRLVKFHDSTIK